MNKLFKDSGYPYLDEIPSTWDAIKLKFLVKEPIKTGAGEEAQIYNPKEIRYIRISDFDKDGNIKLDNKVSIPYEKGKNFPLSDGDLLLATAGATVGKATLFTDCGERCCYAGYLAKVRTNNSLLLNKYLLYVFQSPLFERFKAHSIVKSTIENISASKYANMAVPVPPVEEQKKIVEYLDNKCRNIDSAIAKSQLIINKLNDFKKSTITDALTKGLNEQVDYRNSGIDWIGEVPAHWDIMKLKYIFKIKKDIANEKGLTVLSITQKGICPKDISENKGQIAEDYSKYQKVNDGDFAMNHMDLLTGWVDISKYNGVTSPDYRVFCTLNEQNCDKYLLYLLQSCYFNKVFYGMGAGVSGLGRWRLQSDSFLNAKFPIPPLSEQIQIANYLDNKCSKIDKVINTQTEVIEKLKEYKGSLINKAILGRKEL